MKIELNSEENFIIDQAIRSMEAKDWIYQFPEISNLVPIDSKKKSFYSALYCKIKNWIDVNVEMVLPDTSEQDQLVTFHKREGWVLEKAGEKAYLGKIIASSTPKMKLGRMSYFSGHSKILGNGYLSVGMFSCVAENCCISTSKEDHPTRYPALINWANNRRLPNCGLRMEIEYEDIGDRTSRTIIGNDVWIGRDVRIQSGAVIPDGCIIGERSFVRGELEPYGVYVGTPAVRKRDRCSERAASELMMSKWWEWPVEKIRAEQQYFGTKVEL